MAEIPAALVKELREETSVGLMECKRALVEAQGDKAAAVKILRQRGIVLAAKKATRAANQGVIASAIVDNGRAGSLIEVNCETDFVAKNPTFRALVQSLAEKAAGADINLAETAKAEVAAKIAEIGENIVVRRALRYALPGAGPARQLVRRSPDEGGSPGEGGAVTSYIHHGSTIGVLLEVLCQKAETAAHGTFRETIKDLCLQIASANPRFRDRQSVPAEIVSAEREIYAAQVKDKPAAIVDKIVNGKMNKYYEQVCLVEEPFVKEPTKTIAKLLQEKGGLLGDTLVVQRFARFQVGEAT